MAERLENRKEIFVLDTNVLINDPKIIYSFPGAEVVIPQVVLTELDHLKVSRTADKNRRFRGREVSRMLFELSEQGVLIEGVKSGDSFFRVAVFQQLEDVPPNLNLKNPDDQILAIAHHLQHTNKVTLVTNDLNMLIKAQTIGVPVRRFEEEELETLGLPPGFWRKVLWGLVAVSLIVLIIAVGLLVFYPRIRLLGEGQTNVNQQVSAFLIKEFKLKQQLGQNPKDFQALVGLANLYFDNHRFLDAITYYNRSLKVRPRDLAVHTDLGTSYFNVGLNDAALKQFDIALKLNPDFPNANYNKGVVLLRGKNEPGQAIKYFNKYLELEPKGKNSQAAKALLEEAKSRLVSD